MTKVVVVHGNAKLVEKMWANQFAGLDAEVKKQFQTTVDWSVRGNRVFTIPSALTWDGIVNTVSEAAKAAGSGGVVIVASGHGGVGVQPDGRTVVPRQGIIIWDASATDPDRSWTEAKVANGLFWDQIIMEYKDIIYPQSRPATRKEEDEQNLGSKLAKARHDAFDALEKTANALQGAAVKRLAFTVCTAGSAAVFMDRLAKHCHTQVACFKLTTTVLDDNQFNAKMGGKARLVMDRDKSTDGQGTNTFWARVYSPDLDDSSIAYVANP